MLLCSLLTFSLIQSEDYETNNRFEGSGKTRKKNGERKQNQNRRQGRTFSFRYVCFSSSYVYLLQHFILVVLFGRWYRGSIHTLLKTQANGRTSSKMTFRCWSECYFSRFSPFSPHAAHFPLFSFLCGKTKAKNKRGARRSLRMSLCFSFNDERHCDNHWIQRISY